VGFHSPVEAVETEEKPLEMLVYVAALTHKKAGT
jgi:hypothetical protein